MGDGCGGYYERWSGGGGEKYKEERESVCVCVNEVTLKRHEERIRLGFDRDRVVWCQP